jgi:L-ornithine N5-oxygenase
LLNTPKYHVYDCVGIGFGPSNIALAIALEERGVLDRAIFLEASDDIRWHPGMLIEGSDIQHNPLRDLVTPRNPCSPYGFLSYLKANDRLFDYLNLSAPFPPRSEYAGYVTWVAKHFLQNVRLSTKVVDIKLHNQSGDDVFFVETSDNQVFGARSIVLGCGRSRYVPQIFTNILSENVIHSDDYLWAKLAWSKSTSRPKIAVIGGSQSAIEIILDLSQNCDVINITRGFGFKQKDLSPFTECIYYPSFVEYFHSSSTTSQHEITRELWRSNYSAADHDVINSLNFRLYEQSVTGHSNITLLPNCMINSVERLNDSERYIISATERHLHSEHVLEVDGIILATGYKNFGSNENQEIYHPILSGVSPFIVQREDGGPDVLRNYQINTNLKTPPLFLNGLCESSHGFGDAGSFSILSVRGDMIASSLIDVLSTTSSLDMAKRKVST